MANKLQADEISSIIKERIENFEIDVDINEVGKVVSVGDGIAKVYGLNNVMSGEMIELISSACNLFATSSPFQYIFRVLSGYDQAALS